MKKLPFIIVFILLILVSTIVRVNADEVDKNDNFDQTINEILENINEEDFIELTNLLNSTFFENKSIKEWVVSFITGEITIDISNIKLLITSVFAGSYNLIIEIVCYFLFVGILYTVINKINYKKNDNKGNNAIYFICYSVVVTLFVYMISRVLNSATQSVNKMVKTAQLAFPLLITLGEFCGGFGVGLYKPITAISSFLSSVVYSNFFLPIISTCFVCVLVGNISPDLKLNSLSKTLISLVKWVIGIITVIFGVVLTSQGLVNAQYNGLSFKIFKYATGSMIPIVGNFISGGLDTLISSAIIVKNSFGLILVLYLIIVALSSGLLILFSSFVLKFFISLAEPILDSKFVSLTSGVSEVLNVLCATVFMSAFSYILVCLSVINSTALIV